MFTENKKPYSNKVTRKRSVYRFFFFTFCFVHQLSGANYKPDKIQKEEIKNAYIVEGHIPVRARAHTCTRMCTRRHIHTLAQTHTQHENARTYALTHARARAHTQHANARTHAPAEKKRSEFLYLHETERGRQTDCVITHWLVLDQLLYIRYPT